MALFCTTEAGAGFETERSDVLDVKSGQRPDFSFDTRDAGSTTDSCDPVPQLLSNCSFVERATGFDSERSELLDVKSG